MTPRDPIPRQTEPSTSAITRWLKTAPPSLFVFHAGFAGFFTYFSMYAFRKPFLASTYEGVGAGRP